MTKNRKGQFNITREIKLKSFTSKTEIVMFPANDILLDVFIVLSHLMERNIESKCAFNVQALKSRFSRLFVDKESYVKYPMIPEIADADNFQKNDIVYTSV